MKVVFLIGTLGEYAKHGDALSAEDFRLLDELARQAEVEAEVVFAVTDLKVAGKPDKATMTMIRAERARVIEEINGHSPDVVMCLGPKALACALNKGNVPVAESMRMEIEFAPHVPDGEDAESLTVNAPCYATHSLEHVGAKPGLAKWLRLDLTAALHGMTDTQYGDHRVLQPDDPDWNVCPDDLRDLEPGTIVGFDLETYPGLDPWHPDARIRMAVVSASPDKAYVVQLAADSRLPQWLSDICADGSVLKAGSNIKYDHRWLNRFGHELVNMWDTSTAEHILDETNPLKDLKSLTFLYLPRLGDYSRPHRMLVKERGGWEHVGDNEQYDYAGGDGEASVAAAQGQAVKLRERGLMRPFRLSMKLYKVLADMEAAGCRIDMKENARLDGRFAEALDELRDKICGVLGPINPNSPPQLVDALYEYVPDINLKMRKYQAKRQFSGGFYSLPSDSEEDNYTTQRAVLEREAEKHPVIADILLWRKLQKLSGTYVHNLRERYITPHNGVPFLHTSFRTDVVETYRLSSQGPNLQNIPRKPDPDDPSAVPADLNVKAQYVSRYDGGYFMEGDLSQAEIRIAAMLSGDEAMLDAINSGEDIHTAMAATLLDKPLASVTKEERQRCKRLTFLILYGGGANTLGKQLGVTKEHAKELIAQYFQTFKQLDFYITRVKMRVKKHLQVESPFGYVRRFKKPLDWMSWDGWRIERQAWNFLVQNTASCCAFVSMIGLQEALLERKLKSKLVLQVHDSVGLDVHPDEVSEVAHLVRHHLENPDTEYFGVTLTVPMKADVEIGTSWGTKKAYNFGG